MKVTCLNAFKSLLTLLKENILRIFCFTYTLNTHADQLWKPFSLSYITNYNILFPMRGKVTESLNQGVHTHWAMRLLVYSLKHIQQFAEDTNWSNTSTDVLEIVILHTHYWHLYENQRGHKSISKRVVFAGSLKLVWSDVIC